MVDKLDKVRGLASKLEGICARLSNGFYYEGRSRQDRSYNNVGLLYLHALAWGIQQDLEVIESSQKKDGKDCSYTLKDIVSALNNPVMLPRNFKRVTFDSTEHKEYSGNNINRAIRHDVLTIYDLLFSSIPFEIRSSANIPEDEKSILRAYAFNVLLNENHLLLNESTGFKILSRSNKFPFDEEVCQRAGRFLSDLQSLAEFPIDDLMKEYLDCIKSLADKEFKIHRQIRSSTVSSLNNLFSAVSFNDENNGNISEEVSVDHEQYQRFLELKSKLVDVLRESKTWEDTKVLEALANFYYESNPWNYLVYFEVQEAGMGRQVSLVPSKRREEKVYVDYTGNLDKVMSWMNAIVEGKKVPHLALTGNPGTGKTAALIKACSHHNVKLISIDMDILLRGYLGSVVEQARSMKEHYFVIYIDNIDIPQDEEIRANLYFHMNNLERTIEGPTSLGGNVRFAMSTSTYNNLPKPLAQRFSYKLDFPNPDVVVQRSIIEGHLIDLGIEKSPDEVLRKVYEIEDLTAVKQEDWKTPRELKDAILQLW